MERDCRKEVHTVVALSNSEGQTAGGTCERQQRRALATTPQGAGRVRRRNEKGGVFGAPEGAGREGVTKMAEKQRQLSTYNTYLVPYVKSDGYFLQNVEKRQL